MLQDPAFAKKVLSDKVRSTVSKVAALENTSEKLVKAIQSSEQWSWLKGSKMEENLVAARKSFCDAAADPLVCPHMHLDDRIANQPLQAEFQFISWR